MNRIRWLFKPAQAEASHSQGTTTHNTIIATSSTINSPGGDQYITNNYSGPPAPLPSASITPLPSQAPFNDAPIDNLSIHFTGRRRELALIAKAFERRGDVPLRCALFGNQGVGKSQLTYSWAKSTFSRKENAYIMWISATTIEKLFQGFCRLLRFVNHPDQSHSDQNVRLEAARRWLEEIDTGNWLLVFDNVFPETVDFFRQHLPRVNGRGTILFTTRTRGVADAVTSTAGEQHQVIEVPLLDVTEGVELFCSHFDAGMMDPLSPKVEAIVKAVASLPLAIAHAAAYTKESRSTLDDVLDLYHSKHKIDVIGWEHTLTEYEHKSVAATFLSQLQDLEQHCPDASNLVRLLTFFDPEGIPLEMLITGAKAVAEVQEVQAGSSLTVSLLALIQSPIARQNAITHLQSRCLVTYHGISQSPTFRIHDLIQLVILENTKRSGLETELFEFAVELACAAFKRIENVTLPQCWPQCELVVPHIQSLTIRQDISIKTKKALLRANNSRGLYLSNRGRYVEAESLYQHITADMEQIFGPNDEDTLLMMGDFAWVYHCTGRYVDAETLFKRVLESYKTQIGPEHRNTLRTMRDLADVYYFQQRYNDAETLCKQTIQSLDSQFGSEDNDTLRTMYLLADVYHHQGRDDEAKTLLTQVLQAQEPTLGSENRFTLLTKHTLASVYVSQLQFDAAAALFEQILHAWKRDLGSQHPDTLHAMYSLGRVYYFQGRYTEAENLLECVLAAEKRILGPSHPSTHDTVTTLASVYEALGRLEEAGTLRQCLLP